MSEQASDTDWRDWTELAAAECFTAPGADDDKYSRGVLGVVTGSDEFPGAAVLGVEAAARTGLGMVRYLGPDTASRFVLQARPEAVTASGRVQAWLVGSGMSAATRSDDDRERLTAAFTDGAPIVVDAGALDLLGSVTGPAVITPHAGELVGVLGVHGITVDRAAVQADPAHWAERAADATGLVVLLKGRTTHVCSPLRDGERIGARIEAPSSWAATAGSGDVLGGILGAVIATHAEEAADPQRLVALAATAAYVHAWAAERASHGGPIVASDIAASVPRVIARLISGIDD
ncbi:ADP-dependent NAD(P)H-hydrate dehydratase [Herbiconiux sp. YIM B11900]|uniref:ADP-dependent NAD(P)H-hydrate dehydratase n=1 Tax=Herbiconiux sp. YIM B11900 TaxID=3404131 RepID=UPI003F85D030